MDKKTVELYIMNITSSQLQSGSFTILLNEVCGSRQIPIIVGEAEAQATLIALRRLKPSRPLTHDLYMITLNALGVRFRYVLIYKVQDGIFYSYIYLQKGNEIYRIDARTSDAIALAVRAQSTILIYDFILEHECLHPAVKQPFAEYGSSYDLKPKEDISINYGMLNIKTLDQLLTKAIEEEDYETAAKLRDQINLQKTKK